MRRHRVNPIADPRLQPQPQLHQLRRWPMMLLAIALVLTTAVSSLAQPSRDRRQLIIERYETILERRPEEGTILERLLGEVGGGRALESYVEAWEERVLGDPDDFAAQMILGHLLKRIGRFEDAVVAYSRAAEINPGSPLPTLSLADALYRGGRLDEAREMYEAALETTSDRRTQENILFALADMAFARRDFDEAITYFERIVDLNPRDVFIREQLAEALLEYSRYDEAMAQYEAIVELAGRDTRQRALAMGNMGDVRVLMGDIDGAVEIYRDAQGLTRRGSWIFDDLERRVIDAYRASDDLLSLVAYYEDQWTRPTAQQMRILAELLEDVGREEDALEMWRSAVDENPRSIDLRLQLIRVLERHGEMEEVIAQYEALRDRSDEPIHHFRLAEIHRMQGNEEAAVAVLVDTEGRFSRNATVLRRLADLYLRWGMRTEARRLYERLIELEPDDPDNVVALGQFYFMEGEREAALELWYSLPGMMEDEAEAYHRLGLVLAAHGLVDESVVALEEAMARSEDADYVAISMAEILEDSRRYATALEYWMRLATTGLSSFDREHARNRVIAILERQGVLRDRVATFDAAFRQDPPDPTAGLLLAEAHLALEDPEAAELVLLDLLDLSADDPALELEVLLPLASLYEEQDRLHEAISTLQRVAEQSADHSRDASYRIVDLALRAFDDQLAVQYATRVVEENPHDARAYARLAEVYRRMGQHERAVAAYTEALRVDSRATDYALELAEIYTTLGQLLEADALYRQVVRSGRNESDIQRAGRRAIQLNEGLGTLESLITEWDGLVFRPNYERVSRQLFVDLYERLVEPLRTRLTLGTQDQREGALTELQRLGGLGASPLGAAAADQNPQLRADALRLLADLRTPTALGSITRYVSDPTESIRMQAVAALGSMADASAVDALVSAAADSSASVRALAAWALGEVRTPEVRSPEALEPLLTLRRDRDPDVRIMATLALGRLSEAVAGRDLLAGLEDEDAGVRRASMWALGELAHDDARGPLESALRDGDEPTRRIAAIALGHLTPTESTVRLLAETMWAGPEARVRQAAAAALRGLGGSDAEHRAMRIADVSVAWSPTRGSVDASALLEAWFAPALHDGEPGLALLEGFAAEIFAVIEALAASDDAVVIARVLDLLNDASGDGVGFGALVGPDDDVHSLLVPYIRTLSDQLLQWTQSSELTLRAGAVELLARAGLGQVDDFLVGLSDSALTVRRAAAWALGQLGEPEAQPALEGLLRAGDCATRAVVAEAYGRVGGDLQVLTELLEADECALVRAASALGIALTGDASAVSTLTAQLSQPDDMVRSAIAQGLALIDGAQSREVLQGLRSDPSPAVRAIAETALQ